MKCKSTLVIILILSLTSSCINQQTSPPELSTATVVIPTNKMDISIVTIIPSIIPIVSTYTNELAGFSIDYPSNWFLEVYTPTSGLISSWDAINSTPNPEKGYVYPDEFTKIDISLIKQELSLDEAEAKSKYDHLGNAITFTKEKSVHIENYLQGILIEVEGLDGRPIRHLIVVLNGYTIYISGYGNLERFDEIALSFRTIK